MNGDFFSRKIRQKWWGIFSLFFSRTILKGFLFYDNNLKFRAPSVFLILHYFFFFVYDFFVLPVFIQTSPSFRAVLYYPFLSHPLSFNLTKFILAFLLGFVYLDIKVIPGRYKETKYEMKNSRIRFVQKKKKLNRKKKISSWVSCWKRMTCRGARGKRQLNSLLLKIARDLSCGTRVLTLPILCRCKGNLLCEKLTVEKNFFHHSPMM